MNAAPGRRSTALRVDLTLPITRIGVGPFGFDPLAQLLGASPAELFEPLRVGPVVQRRSASGTAIEVHPLALPDGEAVAIPLGPFGELGFGNEEGVLVLTAPWALAAWLGQRLGDAILRGPEADAALGGARLWVRLRPGARVAFPLGSFGELGVEAGPVGEP